MYPDKSQARPQGCFSWPSPSPSLPKLCWYSPYLPAKHYIHAFVVCIACFIYFSSVSMQKHLIARSHAVNFLPVKYLYPIVVSISNDNLSHGVYRYTRYTVQLTRSLAIRPKGRYESSINIKDLNPNSTQNTLELTRKVLVHTVIYKIYTVLAIG